MLDKKYEPASFEKEIFDYWDKLNIFKAKVDKNKPPFCVILPPPNITSRLHVGHALNGTLQDVLIRYKKMCGYETLFQPGTDHAAIATEAKIVTALYAEGIKKEDITREQFLVRAEEWYAKYNKIILDQFKALGLGCDWSRLAFTMDEHCSLAVRTVFVNMYNNGIIYKGDRMTNWCPHCMTALSDIEVVHKDAVSKLWYIFYPFEDNSGYLTIATTRPETLLGDVAIAVNPKDSRYTKIVGKNVWLPIVNKLIPVVADRMVDIHFGTGAVKITPAHDANDYETAVRHNLPIIQVIEKNGTMSANTGIYAGMDRFVARDKIVIELKKLGNLDKEEKYNNSIGHCERCDTIIEPSFTKQWYVKMADLAKPAIECVKSGELTFHPARMKKVYLHWMENVHDWCISRQLWSGHQIPVFTCENGHEFAHIEKPDCCPKCKNKNLVQETDVLDTWFSSALWPMSTLGFPNKDEFFDYFYPTSVLVTAYDIIFLWVARMIFSGIKHTGKIPFKKVFLNGIVRDEIGRKMSKNLGNGIDPSEVINKYGADAIRFSLVYNVSLGADSKYSMKKAEQASIFLNKLYNAGKFVLANIKGNEKSIEQCKLNIFDEWILDELNKAVSSVNKKLEKMDIGTYATIMYDFVWNKFCDKYIELVKVSNQSESSDSRSVMLYVYTTILQLLQPIVPCITEKIYLELTHSTTSILNCTFPKPCKYKLNKQHLGDIEKIFNIITDIRSMRGENKIGENVKVDISIVSNERIYNDCGEYIKKLCLVNNLLFSQPAESLESYIIKNTNNYNMYLKNPNFLGSEKLIEKYMLDLEIVESEINRSKKMLDNPKFVQKAPETLISAEKLKLENNMKVRDGVKDILKKMGQNV